VVLEEPVEFNLQPDPRVLRMLGEINLPQWRCLAELIDNAIDGFMNAVRAEGVENLDPLQVHVSLPTRDAFSERVMVRDTGPGMEASTLEKAMRAGWSGNGPINNLGLFGMGANIATARLGDKTTVWTTRVGDRSWVGVEIDFAAMTRRGDYRVPALTRPKTDPLEHGTEVIIERLKPEQRQWFAKPANLSNLRKKLGRAYAPMLRPDGVPLTFTLKVNAILVRGRRHCVWGGPGNALRRVQTAKYGVVDAYQTIDVRLPDRPYCTRCWQWLAREDEPCPMCGVADDVVIRRRHVHGWVGLQRYLDADDYGFDIVRNGRVIEIANKDLFQWTNGETPEEEYPIDDPRHRGRLVGEIHLDHCRVTYTKDRFERDDPAWAEMRRIVRGDGPLRPDKAKDEGYGQNVSPLFLLFQAFRRSSPKGQTYTQLLAVRDNELAKEFAERFQAGSPAFQSDAKWWELVEEADRESLKPPSPPPGTGSSGGGIPGFGASATPTPSGSPGAPGGQPGAGGAAPGGPVPGGAPPPPRVAPRRPIVGLSREYVDDLTKMRWNVKAFEVDPSDPDLLGREHPWRLRRLNSGVDEFLANVEHEIFQSATMTILDALLYALVSAAMDFQRGTVGSSITHDIVLASLRGRYAGASRLDPVALAGEAREALRDIARGPSGAIEDGEGGPLFYELSPTEREAVQLRMGAKFVVNPQRVIEDGTFLEYAPYDVLRAFLERHPEYFFDGAYWDAPYDGLAAAYAADMDDARAVLVRYYASLVDDAIWLANQDSADVERVGRDRLLRAALSVDLLRANVVGGAGE
jgi:hypothetical protein